MSLNTGNAILSNAISVDSSYNVGIGTTTPLGKLHVSSPTAVDAYIVSSGGDYDTNLYLGYASAYTQTYIKRVASNLVLGTTNVDRLTIGYDGNVGIGTSSPVFALDISTSSYKTFRIQSSDDAIVTIGSTIASSQNWSIGATANASGQGSNLFFIGTSTNNPSGLLTKNLVINSSGNVGIGTSSPVSKLSIGDPTNVSGATNDINITGDKVNSEGYYARLIFTNSNQSGGSSASIRGERNGSNYGTALTFFTNETGSAGSGTERMRITSGGKALFGTSTAGYGLFGEQRITINPTNDGITIGPLRQNFSAYTLQADNNTGNRYGLYIANASSSEVGSVSFTSSSVSFNTTSDYRLKQDLKDYNGLDLVSAIKTYDFEWKIDNSRSYGVIAHELQEVIPYVVIGDKDGEKLQSVDYSKIVPILVKAIQEMNQTIQNQQKQINSLINR